MRIIVRTAVLLVMLASLALSCAPATRAPAPAPGPAAVAPKAPEAPARPGVPATAKPREMTTVATPWGPAAGVGGIQATVLSKLLKDHSTWLRSAPLYPAGMPKGVEFWEKGKAEGTWALIFNQAAMAEYTQGKGTYATQGPRKDQGLLWQGYPLDIFWVSREGSRFKTLQDVKGSRLGLGQVGTATLDMQLHALELGLGLKPQDYKPYYATGADAVSLMKEGTTEVASWGHVAAKGVPYSYLEDLASSVKLQFMPATQAMVDKVNKSLGGQLYSLNVIPAGIYRNQTADVPMMSTLNFKTLPTMYSEEIAYELARVWWDYHDEGVEMSSRVGLSQQEMTKWALRQKWAFDWHPGALKYYKEKGWI